MNSNVLFESYKLNQINKVLIITSVAAEKEAVLSGLQGHKAFNVVVSGVGVAAAAATSARVLATKNYDLVINAGIAGGFVGQAEVGTIAIASKVIAADLGTETVEGFSSIDELGFGSSRYTVDPNLVSDIKSAFSDAGKIVATGPILTVSTVTGTAKTTLELLKREPGAVAEAMEGFGVATAAEQIGVPMLEIRTISNAVGPRDRGSWRIKEALKKLQEVSHILQEVLR